MRWPWLSGEALRPGGRQYPDFVSKAQVPSGQTEDKSSSYYGGRHQLFLIWEVFVYLAQKTGHRPWQGRRSFKRVFPWRPLRGMRKKTSPPPGASQAPSEKSLQLAECFLHLLPKVTFNNQIMSQFKLKQPLSTITVHELPNDLRGSRSLPEKCTRQACARLRSPVRRQQVTRPGLNQV